MDEEPQVEEITTSTGIPIIEVGLTGDVPYRELREMARQAEKSLKGIPGVASLKKYGYLDREIKIQIDRFALEKHQVPAHEIVQAIRNRHIRSTGGSFESYTSERNIVTLAQFRDPSEVGEVIVRAEKKGALVRISDLAESTDAFEPAKVLSRMNGKPAISFLVYKKEPADMIRTVDAIKALVEKNSHRRPQGVTIEYSNDKSRIVKNRLRVVATNGLIGLILVLIVLSLLLDLRTAFWVAMGIPVALAGTLFFLPVMGFLAMLGVIGLIGIVVNDSLILVNLVNELRTRHPDRAFIDVVVEATATRLRPILLTSITTVAGLLPLAYGIGGYDPYAAPMALAMGYGILFATPLTLVLLPCLLLVQNDVERLIRIS